MAYSQAFENIDPFCDAKVALFLIEEFFILYFTSSGACGGVGCVGRRVMMTKLAWGIDWGNVIFSAFMVFFNLVGDGDEDAAAFEQAPGMGPGAVERSIEHGGAAAVEVGLEVFEELVKGAAERVGGELDGGAVVAHVDGHRLAFEGIGLAVEEVVGVFEDDGDGTPFISGEDDRFEALDLGPGDVAGGEATGVVGEAGIIDDEAGAVLDDLAEVEGAEEKTHGNDQEKQDADEDGKDETGGGLLREGEDG